MTFVDTTEYESEWSESEWESESELSEARRRQPARPGRYTQPPLRGYVTQTQFQTALDKVRADVAQNARAISSVGSNLDALSKRTRTEIKGLRDEQGKFRDETRGTLQTLAILPLLSSGGSVTVNDTSTPPKPVAVATPASSLMQLLPLLLLSGSFGGMGTSGTGGSSSSGMDSGLMLAVLLLAAGGGLGSATR
jgi:hypothetical protein